MVFCVRFLFCFQLCPRSKLKMEDFKEVNKALKVKLRSVCMYV